MSEVLVVSTEGRTTVKYDASGRPTSVAADRYGSATVDWHDGTPVFSFVAPDGKTVTRGAHTSGDAHVAQATVQADTDDCDAFSDALSSLCAGGELTGPAFAVACGLAAVEVPVLLPFCEKGALALEVICAGVEAQGGTLPPGTPLPGLPDVIGTVCSFLFDPPVLGHSVIGTVRDSATNAPIQNASVTVGDSTTFTDFNGYYVARPRVEADIPSYPVTVAANGYNTDVSALGRWPPDTQFLTVDRLLTRQPFDSIYIVGSTRFSVGFTAQFQAAALVPDGTASVDLTSLAVWQSSNPSVATVSPKGLVTGVGDGSATITATFMGKSGSIAVTVINLHPAIYHSGGFSAVGEFLGRADGCVFRFQLDFTEVTLEPQILASGDWRAVFSAKRRQTFGPAISGPPTCSAAVTVSDLPSLEMSVLLKGTPSTGFTFSADYGSLGTILDGNGTPSVVTGTLRSVFPTSGDPHWDAKGTFILTAD